MSDVKMSSLAWGAWRILETGAASALDQTVSVLSAAHEVGMTTIDTADIYGDYEAEAALGDALSAWGRPRGGYELVTKCGIKLLSGNRPDHQVKHYDSSAGHIQASVEASLKALQTDYIDVLLIHRPDMLMDADETGKALDSFVKSGKVRRVGVSNFNPSQWDLLQSRMSERLLTNQVECSVAHLDPIHDATFDHAQQQGVRPMIWSPLAGGQLFSGQDEKAVRLRAILQEIAAEQDVSDIGIIALAWVLKLPVQPHVIVGTNSVSRVQSYAQAGDISLSRQQWYRIYEASLGHEVA